MQHSDGHCVGADAVARDAAGSVGSAAKREHGPVMTNHLPVLTNWMQSP
jgi:hypothetical protein